MEVKESGFHVKVKDSNWAKNKPEWDITTDLYKELL